jgi:hypothetical protein
MALLSTPLLPKQFKVRIHGAIILSATYLAMALQHNLHGIFLRLTGRATRIFLRDKLQQSAKVEFASTFGNDCRNLCQRCTV